MILPANSSRFFKKTKETVKKQTVSFAFFAVVIARNPCKHKGYANPIIPYQEQLGNYNLSGLHFQDSRIIPYQEQ